MKDEEFDEQLKQKLDPLNTGFKEIYWLRAKELIKADRQFKTNRWFFSLVLIAIIGAIAGLGLFMKQYQQKHRMAVLGPQPAMAQHARGAATEAGKPQAMAAPILPPVQVNAVSMQSRFEPTLPEAKNSGADNGLNPYNKAASTFTRVQAKPATHVAQANSDPDVMANATETPFEAGAAAGNTAWDQLPAAEVGSAHTIVENDIQTILGRQAVTMPVQLICDTCNAVRIHFHKELQKQAMQSFLAFEAGVTAFNGLSAAHVSQAAGLRYYYFYNGKAGVSIGLEYRILAQQLDTRKYTRSTYEFGNNVETRFISTTRLNYLQFPLELLYRPGKRSTFRAGVNFLVLVQTSEKVVTVVTGEVVKNTTTYEHGYFNAVHGTDLQLSVGYAYRINNKWYLSAGWYRGLTDVSENAVFKSNKVNINQGFSIALGYKIR